MDGEIARIERFQPAPANRLYLGGVLLQTLKWDNVAIRMFKRCLALESAHAKAMNACGVSLTSRATRKFLARDITCKDDFELARRYFEQALSIRPDYWIARRHLENVRTQLDALQAPVPSNPQDGS